MKLFLIAAFALASLACEKPCALQCADNSECPTTAICYRQVACLPTCLSCGGHCIQSLHDNCGSCGNACLASQLCETDGHCADSCAAGETPCNGACTSVANDPFNCGACGNACNPQAGQVCASGACTTVNSC